MELDDFLYTSAGRGRYACFTGTNRLMFITHRTDKYTELDEVKMVTKGGCTWKLPRLLHILPCSTATQIVLVAWTTIWKWLSRPASIASI